MDEFSPAKPTWDEEGRLFSPLYGDIYGSRQGAQAQARHVFLGGNRLPERFAALRSGGSFTVGETGFGTGLNFLAAWRLFEEVAPAGTCLHFVSVEKHPLGVEDVKRALTADAQAGLLLAQWPLPLPGTHRLGFPLGEGRLVTLTLLYGEAADMLEGASFERGADAWFFDGFSPQKNPAMWSADVFAAAARLSAPGATCATWTVGEKVREGLTAAGFVWERKEGFGKKREMLVGGVGESKNRDREGAGVETNSTPAPSRSRFFEPKDALVVGAGLAGCAAARALAERGMHVTLVDAHGIGAGASGNPQGLVQPMLAAADGVEGHFNRAAFAFAIRRLAQLAPDLWHPCGSLWLCANDKALALARRRLAKLNWPTELLREVDAAEGSALAGISLPHPAVYCAAAGWVSPLQLCRRLADHPLIQFEQREVARVHGDEAQVVVVACAQHTAAIADFPELKQTRVRGELRQWPAMSASSNLRLVLNFGHYITPADGGTHTVGATHQSGEDDLNLRVEDREELLAAVGEVLPEWESAWRPVAGVPRVGLRCSVADKVPVIGQVPGRANLRLLTALGPRGISTSLLGAELLSAQVFGEPLPVSKELAAAVSPGRFAAQRAEMR